MRTLDNSKKIPDYPEFHPGWYNYKKNWIVRRYIRNWPDKLPLPLAIENSYNYKNNGINDWSKTPLRHMWVYGDREYKTLTCSGLAGSDFVHKCGHFSLYVKYKKAKNKRGTIAMPNHCYNGEIINFENYCKQLNDLPAFFRPIVICLHNNMRQYENTCKKFNIKTICSGKVGPLFVKNQLEMISSFLYLTTTYDGTPLWYGLLAGCKVFYLGNQRKIHIHTRQEFELDEKTHHKVFSIENVDKLLQEKQDLLNLHFGVNYKMSREKMLDLFYRLRKDFAYLYIEELYSHTNMDMGDKEVKKYMGKFATWKFPNFNLYGDKYCSKSGFPTFYELECLSRYARQCSVGIETGTGLTTRWIAKSIQNLLVTINIKKMPEAHLLDNVIYKTGWSITKDDLKRFNPSPYKGKERLERHKCPDLEVIMEKEEMTGNIDLLRKTLKEYSPDFFFCDSGEYSAEAEWSIIKPHLKAGSIAAFHDIYYPKSNKCYKIYDEIRKSSEWEIKIQTDTPQGLLIAKKL